MTELYELTIAGAAELLRQKKISSVELTQAHLDRIRAVDDKVKAFTLVTDELALKEAEEADRRFSRGDTVSPLTGIPIAIKDVICTMGITMGAYGSDTGGSIRQPGSLCNVVGLKPTYGRVSRYGLVAFASSLDQIGPFARNARDAALLMQAIAGHDPSDSTSSPMSVPDYSAALNGSIKGLRIGVPEEYWVEGTQPGVVQAVRKDIEILREMGAEVSDVSLPHTKYGVAAYYIIAPAEASANLARYDGVKYGYSYRDTGDMWEALEKTREYGFGQEVKRRIMLGTYALSSGYYDAYYKQADKVRSLITQDFERAFEHFDVLVSPASPTVAFKLGEISDPYQMYLQDVFTIPANLAGNCGVSIPGGFSNGLPVGLQLLGNFFAEDVILRVADAFERVTDYHTRWPQGV